MANVWMIRRETRPETVVRMTGLFTGTIETTDLELTKGVIKNALGIERVLFDVKDGELLLGETGMEMGVRRPFVIVGNAMIITR